MAISDYQAGRRVYNGYSSSPHKGTDLDPMGYVQRELDSDRRSGIASAIMARQPAVTNTTNGGIAKPTAAPAMVSQTAAKAGAPVPPPKPAKKTTRSKTGKISKKRPGVNILPIDPDINMQRIALMRQRAQAMGDFGRTRRDINTDWSLAMREAKAQQPIDVANLLGSFGARGMGESGGQIVGRTKLESDYQSEKADLSRARLRGLADLGAAQSTFQNSYQSQIERLLMAQAERASAEAGGLNLNQVLKRYLAKYNPKPKKKPAPKKKKA